ncbi:hypothetical protein KQY27_00230 [Methanobrevibacter sp. TMH8]|uniref:hypothetical protein n=1 Tax=Methanobrevibacter sp. TMH8 TaxID=2848611 RepID=UPI001CCB227B|nr:hypothetical protein [Methanobrevibacter sp. TMH8]MBZ9569985.1 hypothetical protein [Methanobrevibacter sp. TMH8]
MDLILIVIASVIAILVRIWIEKGYIMPKIYVKDGVTYFQLNIIGTVFTALISVFVLYQAQPELFGTFLGALITAYTIHLLDNVVTKAIPNSEGEDET